MEIEIGRVNIDREQVLKFMGYGSKTPKPIIVKKVDEEIGKADDIIEPRAFIEEFAIDSVSEDTVLFEGNEIVSEYVAEELKDCGRLYVAVYTVGNRIESAIEDYSNGGEMIRGMILDKIGVVCLDDINLAVKSEIESRIGDLSISSELYPSQRDFGIENQQLLFKLSGADKSLIAINRYNQFTPIKTVAAVFGVGEKKIDYSMCDRCEVGCGHKKG